MAINVVITGANRGIGLSFCKHYHKRGANVIAVCRRSNSELDKVANIVIDGIDVGDADGCNQLFQKLTDTKIDILINNAGILSRETLGQIDYAAIEKQFQINSMAPLRVTEGLLNNLGPDSKVAIITSRMGSIADNSSGNSYGYRMSKAAVNAAGKSLAIDLEPKRVAVGIYHPGWVTTDMTGGTGELTPDQSAEKLAGLIETLDMSNTGTFWHSKGEILPW